MKIEADPILFLLSRNDETQRTFASETDEYARKYSNSKNQVSMQDVDTTATMRLIFSLPTTLASPSSTMATCSCSILMYLICTLPSACASLIEPLG